MDPDWLDKFPVLRDLDSESLRLLKGAAQTVELPPGAKAFEIGSPCDNYLLLLDGSVRVQQLAETGREIVLYRVVPGETCILTAASLLSHQDYAAEGIVETPVRAIAVPRRAFEELLAKSETFRTFVFSNYASRITRLLTLVEEVAFGRVDARLAQRLLARMDAAGQVAATHQDLAVELGTAREVVSRQLKDFERRGWIALRRGRIEVVGKAALAELADQGAAA